jgi:hypothetical protein
MKKRGRGRPKGTKKLPREYYLLLWELAKERLHEGETLSSMCRDVCYNGGVQFVDDNGKVVAEITKWRTLHSRLTEAMFMPRAKCEKWWKRTRRADPAEAFGISLWRGCPWMLVPARRIRRLKVAEFSLAHCTNLHK